MGCESAGAVGGGADRVQLVNTDPELHPPTDPAPANARHPAQCRSRILVFGCLAGGPRRFTELGRLIEGVSQKMLTQTLRGLERDGLVTRTVHATAPPRVDYELTDLGRTLQQPIAALERWATEHVPDILNAREQYDSAHS